MLWSTILFITLCMDSISATTAISRDLVDLEVNKQSADGDQYVDLESVDLMCQQRCSQLPDTSSVRISCSGQISKVLSLAYESLSRVIEWGSIYKWAVILVVNLHNESAEWLLTQTPDSIQPDTTSLPSIFEYIPACYLLIKFVLAVIWLGQPSQQPVVSVASAH